MRTVNNLLQSSLKVHLPTEILLALEDTKQDYVKLQKDQLLSGERSDGEFIFTVQTGSDEYSPAYARYKGKKGPIDLHDKGSFSNEIFVDVRDNEMIVDSADEKSGMLQKNYGNQIFGLNDERKEPYSITAATKLLSNIETEINKR